MLSDKEEQDARTYLMEAGYTVLRGSIPERLEYRQAMRDGCSIAETGQLLKAKVDEVLTDLLEKAADQAERKSRQVPSANC